MQTEIINIGDELLIGQVINTNASWISEQMNLAGFPVHRVTIIPDDPRRPLIAESRIDFRALDVAGCATRCR